MGDLDILRPEVREALKSIEFACTVRYSGEDEYAIIRAELLRLVRDNDALRSKCNVIMSGSTRHLGRAERAEAELAALKARIAGSSVVKIANYGDPFIVLPDHLTVPNSLKGKRVRLVVEE